MSDLTKRYPWYDIVEGNDLEQGDIIECCPVSVATETETVDGRCNGKSET